MVKRYRVTAHCWEERVAEIEADSPEEAERAAYGGDWDIWDIVGDGYSGVDVEEIEDD